MWEVRSETVSEKWESEKSICETVKVHHESGTCASNNNCELQSEGVYSTKKQQDLFPSGRNFLKTTNGSDVEINPEMLVETHSLYLTH